MTDDLSEDMQDMINKLAHQFVDNLMVQMVHAKFMLVVEYGQDYSKQIEPFIKRIELFMNEIGTDQPTIAVLKKLETIDEKAILTRSLYLMALAEMVGRKVTLRQMMDDAKQNTN